VSTASTKRRVGVIGTFVWDVIYGQVSGSAPVESWGGIAYALSGLDAALPDDWEIVPLVKVGADLSTQATEFLGTLRHSARDVSLVEVAEPNNRSELRYFSDERRSEFKSGGVPGWTWDELAPVLRAARLDALYVNFLSGTEIDLEIARRIRAEFRGPIYVDLHMIMWETLPSGLRTLRPLDQAPEWCRCFDLVQVNEDEMTTLAPDVGALADLELDEGVHCTIVTLGRRGVAAVAAPGFTTLADLDTPPGAGERRVVLLPPERVREGPHVDPTGCGDVWGATFFARLLAGDELTHAMRIANQASGRNVEFHGATGLVDYLASTVSLT
jgi:sugar/nucleoside kinase (ribokinase family)